MTEIPDSAAPVAEELADVIAEHDHSNTGWCYGGAPLERVATAQVRYLLDNPDLLALLAPSNDLDRRIAVALEQENAELTGTLRQALRALDDVTNGMRLAYPDGPPGDHPLHDWWFDVVPFSDAPDEPGDAGRRYLDRLEAGTDNPLLLGAIRAVRADQARALDAPAEPAEDSDRRHYDAWGDTGDGYTIAKGWHLSCLWCDWQVTTRTKDEAVERYQDEHERPINARLRSANAPRDLMAALRTSLEAAKARHAEDTQRGQG